MLAIWVTFVPTYDAFTIRRFRKMEIVCDNKDNIFLFVNMDKNLTIVSFVKLQLNLWKKFSESHLNIDN